MDGEVHVPPGNDLVMQFRARPAIETGKAVHEQTEYRERHDQGEWSIFILEYNAERDQPAAIPRQGNLKNRAAPRRLGRLA